MIVNKMILPVLFGLTTYPNPSTLRITIENIRVGKGNVIVEIYDSKEKFTAKKGAIVKSQEAHSRILEFIAELPQGIYALKVFQDINENKRCDEGWFHIPKEPYGLSNNFRPKYTAPTFDDCKVNISGQTAEHIKLN